MIHSVKINNFRIFKDISFQLGKHITAISGQNSTGKSTLLAILGNSCEIKKKDGCPIIQKFFRTEFSEILQGSNNKDVVSPNVFFIDFNFSDDPNDINEITPVPFRTTWQNQKTRFRLIPKRKIEGKVTASKIKWPVLYVGLSRLYPIGEIQDDLKLKAPKIDDEEKKWVINCYKDIFFYHDELQDVKSINTSIKNKTGVGISTISYDYLLNSAGEDNIGQFILSILSFKRLKEKNPNYKGGLLLIDELDATLHPAAQLSLYKFLYKVAKEFNLQIVFTTHSMTLLERIAEQCTHNPSNKVNDIELIYLTKANKDLEVFQNPPYYKMLYDLHNFSSAIRSLRRLFVYTEDNEARWFLEKIIHEYSPKVRMLKINMGHEELLKLRKEDMNYFSTVMFVLDGDVPSSKFNGFNNILQLPYKDEYSENSPESIFYNFLKEKTEEPDHEIWCNPVAYRENFTMMTFEIQGPEIYGGKDRDKKKQWFNDHLPLFEQINLYEYWALENQKLVEDFKGNFIRTFNKLAKLNSLPGIPQFQD